MAEPHPNQLRAAHDKTVRYSPKPEAEIRATLGKIIGIRAAETVRRATADFGWRTALPHGAIDLVPRPGLTECPGFDRATASGHEAAVCHSSHPLPLRLVAPVRAESPLPAADERRWAIKGGHNIVVNTALSSGRRTVRQPSRRFTAAASSWRR